MTEENISQPRYTSHIPSTKRAASRYGILDLFCGTGGFSNGFTSFSPRFRLLGAIDVEPDPAATAQANHPDCKVVQNDIRLIKPSEMGKLIGGQDVEIGRAHV